MVLQLLVFLNNHNKRNKWKDRIKCNNPISLVFSFHFVVVKDGVTLWRNFAIISSIYLFILFVIILHGFLTVSI